MHFGGRKHHVTRASAPAAQANQAAVIFINKKITSCCSFVRTVTFN
jgi:hypothetical protein